MNALNRKISQSQSQSIRMTEQSKSQQMHQSSISHISGFSHIKYAEKRNYFKRIKYKNKDKYIMATWSERSEFCRKLFLYIISNIINVLNIIVFIYQTYTNPNTQSHQLLSNLDLACSIYFLIEYIYIMYLNRHHLIKFLISFDSLIDILTIIPTIVNFYIDNSTLKAVFRMVKVFRVLRIYKSLRALQYEANETIFLSFLTHFQIELICTVVVFFSFFFISSGIILSLQDLVSEGVFNQGQMTFFDAVYYMMITTSTLGYGDIYPTHLVSRLFIILVIIGFISVVSYQIGKFTQLLQLWSNYTQYSFKDHIILICNQTINIDYVLRELKRNDHHQIVLIISHDIEMLPSKEFPFNSVYTLVTQEIDLEIFDRANVKQAKAILIYSSLSFRQYEQSEKVNEFTLLKINEYYHLIPTYIQVLYSERSFSNTIDIGKTMVLKQNVTRINDLGIGGGGIKINKLIPVLRIKNLIISKASFNPGYASFAQNLLFNNMAIPVNLEGYDMPTQAYCLGCENKIVIRRFPRCFIGKDFFEAVRLIYSKSITNYLTKVSSRSNTEINRPVLLIGVIDSKRTNFFTVNKLMKVFPRNFRIMGLTPGVFISYDGNNYVDKVLDLFNQERSDDDDNDDDDEGEGEDNDNGEDKDNKDDNDELEIEKNDHNKEESIIKAEIKSMRRKGFIGVSPLMNLNSNKSINNNEDGDIIIINANHNKNLINNNNNINETEEEQYSIHKISTRNVFLQNKTKFVTNKQKYNDLITKKNVLLLQSFDDNNLFTIESSIISRIKKRYDPTSAPQDSEYFYENRILNISLNSYTSLLSNHILIIGYQDGIIKLLKILSFHFPNKKICILSPESMSMASCALSLSSPSSSSTLDERLIKILKQFSNVYLLIGQIDNPYQLDNANASNAFYVILLIESIHKEVNEDTIKLLSMKTFDYFFNHNSIIEILNPSTMKFFGYNIATTDKAIRANEFLHPMFMNGRVIFLNHFNRILAMSAQGDEMVVDAWLELISIGLKTSLSSDNGSGNKRHQSSLGIPLTITLDVPEVYNGKEYHNLAADMICLSTPVLILGLYVSKPIEYMKQRSEGNINVNPNGNGHNDKGRLNITTSHKMYNVDELVTKNNYIRTLRRLKDLSQNDEAYLDSIDIKHPFTPIFITNPPPWFIISKGTKMLVLYNYIPQLKKTLKTFQHNLIIKLNEKLNNAKEEKIARRMIDEKQEYIHGLIAMLKKKFEEQIALSYRAIEIKHKKNNTNSNTNTN